MGVLSVLDTGLTVYSACLYTRPLLTKSCTSACTAALGDLISQLITKEPKINYYSLVRYAIFGSVVSAPLAHSFYKFLETAIPPNTKGAAIKRLLLDRLGFAPLLLLLSLYLLARMEGKGHKISAKELQLKYWMALKMNWKVWTPVQYINVNYVPQQYRVLFANVVAMFWIAYITSKRRQAAAEAAATKEH